MHYVALTVITLYLCVRPFLLYADGDTDGHYQKQDLKEHERSIITDLNPPTIEFEEDLKKPIQEWTK